MLGSEFDKTYRFEDLERKYKQFLAPKVQVLVDGQDILQIGMVFSTVTVDTHVENSDGLTFTVENAFDQLTRKFRWTDQILRLGNSVEVRMGYSDQLSTVFHGLITSVEYDYPQGGHPTVTVKGLDHSYVMMNGRGFGKWENKTISEVVSSINKEKYKLDEQITATTLKETFTKMNEDDYHFLKTLAARCNYEFFVKDRTLYFRDPLKHTTPVMTLEWGKNLLRLTPRFDIGSQVSEYVVRGTDQKTNEKIEATSRPVNPLIAGSSTISNAMSAFGNQKRRNVHTSLDNPTQAQDLADALMNRQAMQALSGDGESIGLPEIQAGRFIRFAGVGPQFEQAVYLKSVTHRVGASGYVTTFSFGGQRGLVETLTRPEVAGGDSSVSTPSEGRGGRSNGLMRGIVTSNEDPEKLGRVKVSYRHMEEERETEWIRVATMAASNESGSLFIPNVEDEVLVAFHLGELNEPYVIGVLWNQNRKPPAGSGESGNHLRKIRTPAGHELVFDDTDDQKSVVLTTGKGHKVSLQESADKINISDSTGETVIEMNTKDSIIQIKNKGGAMLTLDSDGSVKLTGAPSLNLSADEISIEATRTLRIDAGGGTVSINGSTVEINS